MTNEQLYSLIEWMADTLEGEVDILRRCLSSLEDVERRPNLYKDGEYAGRVADRAPHEYWDGDGLGKWAKDRGFQVRYDGDPVMLAGLLRLLRRLRERSRALR